MDRMSYHINWWIGTIILAPPFIWAPKDLVRATDSLLVVRYEIPKSGAPEDSIRHLVCSTCCLKRPYLTYFILSQLWSVYIVLYQ